MPTDHTVSLGAQIAAEVRAELARQGLTQQQLADRLGVRQWWVSRRVAEDGSRRPVAITAAELVLIAGALRVPVGQFLPRERAAA